MGVDFDCITLAYLQNLYELWRFRHHEMFLYITESRGVPVQRLRSLQ